MANDLVTRLLLNNKNFDNNLKESTRQVKQFQANVGNVNKGLQASLGKIPTVINPLSASFSGLALSVAGVGTAVAGLGSVFMDNVNYNKELDNSLSALNSIIGGTTDSLNTFRDAAIELGRTTPQTAGQVAEAFKIVAQMKPELADNAQALIAATEASLNLANAQGTDVATAADIVVRALNVYNSSARQAARYTNVLAAGCKNGSGDIEWLGTAFGKAGATAKAVGMTYEETITTLELLSRRIKDATSAGSQLRNVLIYLERQNNDQLKPSVVGVSQAIKNLKAEEMDLTQITNMFKKQNVEAVTTLIDAANEFDNLQAKITDTNAAYEMAAERQNNLTGALKRLDSAWQSFVLGLGNSNGALMKVSDWAADFLNTLSGINKQVEKIKQEKEGVYDKNLQDIANTFMKNNPDWNKEQLKTAIESQLKAEQKTLKDLIYKAEHDITFTGGNGGQLNNWKARAKVIEQQLAGRLDLLVEDVFSEIDAKNKEKHQELVVSVDFDIQTASIDDLKDRVKELTKLRDACNDTAQINKYNAQIKEAQDQIDRLKGKTESLRLEEKKLYEQREKANKFREFLSKGIDLNINGGDNIFDDENIVSALRELPDELAAELEPAFEQFIKNQQELQQKYHDQLIEEDTYNRLSTQNQEKLYGDLNKVATSALLSQEKSALRESVMPLLSRIANNVIKEKGTITLEGALRESKLKSKSLQSGAGSFMTQADEAKTLSELQTVIANGQRLIAEITQVQNTLMKVAASPLVPEGANMDAYLEQMQSYNGLLDTLGRLIDNLTEKQKKLKKEMDMSSAISSIASMGDSLSQVFKKAGNDEAAFITQSLAQIGELIAQLANMAITAGVSSAAKLPFPYNLAAIALSVATITSIVGSAMQTFTNGGIVGGGSYSGDKTTIRVNAGEMVLNRSQQANLFRMIEGGNSNKSALSGDVSFRIQGKDLVGVLNNYNNKMSKIR